MLCNFSPVRSARLKPNFSYDLMLFQAPQGTLFRAVLLRIVSGEGWGRRRFQEEEGAGEEMGPETPLPPPFACQKVAGGLPRPRAGTRPRGEGAASPPGQPPR